MRPERLLATPAAPVEDMGILQDLARSPKVARLHALWENMVAPRARLYKKMPAPIHVKRASMVLGLVKSPTASVQRAQMDFIVATVLKSHVHRENTANHCLL